MSDFPVLYNEEDRLDAVAQCGLLDTSDDPRLDRITRLAAYVTACPIALISIVAAQRQWFKSRHGLVAKQTPRDVAFCNYALVEPSIFVVEDATKDDRFRWNALVTGDPGIRFYAGIALTGAAGHRLGTLCVIDTVARALSPVERRLFEDLAGCAGDVLRVAECEIAATDARSGLRLGLNY
ncbi:Diguanylate cyclase [Burkholderia sp. 8Y]|uniref:GAF domain-containing protein n=1 Tax=Burkholderia sp. 8Y TaxID=2653133 RepID=UPI0012EFAE18|nr:GAF domain-containing protein [Burkholderia sp. 8Y]VXC18342.1 Diguanylate cyclase [Burkholderia sp. 8Y]